jgi:lauroyl/myristoyl acyltransferase
MRMLRLLKFSLFLTRWLPDPVCRALCYPFGALTYLLRPQTRRTVQANQRQVLGPVSTLRLQWQTWRVLVNAYHTYYSLLRISVLSNEQLVALVELRGREHLDAALARGRGVIVLGAHLANFNLLAPYIALYHTPAGAIVEPLEPPALFSFVSAVRSRTGLRLLSADREGAGAAVSLLRANGILAVAGDRYLGANGMAVPFFGRPALLPHGEVILALRSGAPIVPASLLGLPKGRVLVEIHPPLPLADTGRLRDDLATNMQLIARALERMIGAAPDQWVMLNPVWPADDTSAGVGGARAVVAGRQRPATDGAGRAGKPTAAEPPVDSRPRATLATGQAAAPPTDATRA